MTFVSPETTHQTLIFDLFQMGLGGSAFLQPRTKTQKPDQNPPSSRFMSSPLRVSIFFIGDERLRSKQMLQSRLSAFLLNLLADMLVYSVGGQHNCRSE